MKISSIQIRSLTAAALLALVSACDSSSDDSSIDGTGASNTSIGGTTVAPPSVLLNARNVNIDRLSPTVELNDGTMIQMTQGADGLWSGETFVAPNTFFELTITWSEELETGEPLQLAELIRSNVDVGPDGTVVQVIDAAEYNTRLDFDEDSFTNLEERENGTDPFDPEDGITDPDGTPTTPGTTTPETPVTTPGTLPPDPDEEEPFNPPVIVDPIDPGEADPDTTDPDETDPDETDPDETDPDETDPDETDPDETGTGTGTVTVTTDPDPGEIDPVTPTDPEDIPTVIIPRIRAADAPQIDGLGVSALAANGSLVGEWEDAVQFDLNGVALGINNLMIDVDDEADSRRSGNFFRRWAAMHDGTRMYVLILSDDVGLRHGDSVSQPWNDDSLELFIDGDNSKDPNWNAREDFQYIISTVTAGGDANLSDNNEGIFIPGTQASRVDIGLEFATGPGVGPASDRNSPFRQDVYEISFIMEDAGIVPGEPVGFEVQLNDDDDGGARDAKYGWFHPARTTSNTDRTFRDPSVMGTIEFE